ncbi:MAG: hypothetical protein EOM23_08040 [Candidatus Moranbacteria bacterium]|nr:hypothetical protein [Candidatus Moranbacteria bacterium]
MNWCKKWADFKVPSKIQSGEYSMDGGIDNFSKLVQDNEEIKEIDINPLLINEQGKFEAVDVKVIF